MTTPKLPLAIRAGIAIILGLFVFVGPSNKSNSALAAPAQAVPTEATTVPAGGSAQLQVRAYALQPGAPVPQGALALPVQPLATDRVRTTLFYGINWGYTDSDPQQVALAIWWAQDGNWLAPDHAAGERIANAAAGSSGLPFWNPNGRSLLTLVAQGQVSISPLSLSPAGTGTLTVTNTGSQSLDVYLPYGTLFTGPSGTAIVWAVASAPVPPATFTTVALPTNTAVAATNTPEPQATPTDTAPRKTGNDTPTPEATTAPAKEASPTATSTQQPATPTATLTAVATATPPQASAPPASAPVQGVPTAAVAPPAKSGSANSVEPAVKPAEPTHTVPVATNTTAPRATAEKNTSRNEVSAPVGPKEEPKQSAREMAPPPPPVVTQVAQVQPTKQGGTSAPPPVGTGVTLATPPNPELTKLATLPPQQATPTPTFTTVVKPTIAPVETPKPGATDGNPAIPPKATPLPPAGDNGGVIINVAPDPKQVPADGTNKTPAPAPAPQPNNNGKPTTNPATGGGASGVPVWLGMFSALLVLGGWSLRRMSNPVLPAVPLEDGSYEDRDS